MNAAKKPGIPSKAFIPEYNLEKNQSEEYIRSLLKSELPKSDTSSVDGELKWHFVLDKKTQAKKRRAFHKKKAFLTRKERKECNLLKLSRTGWSYEELQAMRDMWKDYMRQNLNIDGSASLHVEHDWSGFSVTLAKSEFIGAEVTVVRSTAPSMVDLSGTVVLETKMTFQIVTRKNQLKIIPKQNSVFAMHLDQLKFTIFGKHLMTRPSERSVKKIKSLMVLDI